MKSTRSLLLQRRYLSLTHRRVLSSSVRQPLLRRGFHSTSSVKQEFKDPYETLGVKKSSSQSDIKKAYYKLAKKYHPDINKEAGAEKKFHDLQNAYEILSDESKRKQYDQFGAAAFSGGAGAGPGGPGAGPGGFNPFGNGFGFDFSGGQAGGAGGFGGINFEDLFGTAFGGGPFGSSSNGGRRSSSMFREYKGDTIEVIQNLDFKDAVFGKKNVSIKFRALDPCGTCNGSGLKSGASKTTCPSCHGSGTTVHVRAGFQMMSTCQTCGGEGTTVNASDFCKSCHGEGVNVNTQKTITVDLPHGLQDGDVVRIPGQGSYPDIAVDKEMAKSVKLSRGDILVRIRVNKDPHFSIKNKYDIWYTKEIPITTAALGGTVSIPTIDGTKIRIKVPAGTAPEQVISIPNMGVPKSSPYRNSAVQARGDMKIQYKVVIRKPQSKAEQCLWEALADVTNDTNAKRTMESFASSVEKSVEDKLSDNDNKTSNNSKETYNTTEDNSMNPDAPSTLGRLEKFISNTFKKIKGDKN
ncbi:DnaJ domain [Nakaseomyces glabratus]|nr:DnaJ domain [Nakaseomyces glabratus]KAH7587216.1 DnaJ domain [Nakaseomyces glabratus]KTB19209.1 DnaJ -like protein 1, mitochondrial [Nakaseomyces glabratus]KTB19255.1 DnaJ -like protein 1, mitochondrial [Nakaseomyces glabratus]